MEPFPIPDTESKFTTSFYDRVSDWVLAVAGDTLRSSDRAGDRYTAEVLAGVVFQLALDHGDRWISERSTRDRISERSLWSLCEKKSRWLVRTFRPALTKEQMSRGGKRSKRRSHLLELFRSLDPGLSITEAAEALHCHPRTVSKLRAMLAAEPSADDLIIAQLDAEAATEVHDAEPVIEPVIPEPVVESIPETTFELSTPTFEQDDPELDALLAPDPVPVTRPAKVYDLSSVDLVNVETDDVLSDLDLVGTDDHDETFEDRWAALVRGWNADHGDDAQAHHLLEGIAL